MSLVIFIILTAFNMDKPIVKVLKLIVEEELNNTLILYLKTHAENINIKRYYS